MIADSRFYFVGLSAAAAGLILVATDVAEESSFEISNSTVCYVGAGCPGRA
jgi:hypothetical protein